MPCSVRLEKKAMKFLERAPRKIANRIRERLDELSRKPVCDGRFKGELRELCKTRLGSYRIAYLLKSCSIWVIDIGPRGTFYNKLKRYT